RLTRGVGLGKHSQSHAAMRMGMHTMVSLVNMAPAKSATEPAHQYPAPLDLLSPSRDPSRGSSRDISCHFRNAISEAKKNAPPSPSTLLQPIHATLSTLEGCRPNSSAVSSARRASPKRRRPKR